MKRVLVVSPHFPPINAPDMQRVRMGLPYYRDAGWEPTILSVKASDIEGVLEPELMATIPPATRIVETGAWPAKWTRRVGVGNIALRGFNHLRRAGNDLLARERFDLVFFSNTQFGTFPLGNLWRRRFGVPFVLDMQDPWRTDYYERKGSRKPPGGWKYQFARLQAAALEGPTVSRAAGVMSVSGSYIDDLRARYRNFTAPAEVIPFGASRADLDVARAGPPSPAAPVHRGNEVHFTYTGASGPVMPHALMVLFEALRRYRERQPEQANRFRFHFFGTSYVPAGRGVASVIPIAEVCRVADLVDEVPHRLGHLECIRLQADADILLLPGSSDLAYSPSKVYPYYLSAKPILGLVFRDSVMEQLLDELRCAYMVRFREREAKDEAYETLARFFEAVAAGTVKQLLPQRNEQYFSTHFLAESLTHRQCALFDRALEFEKTR